MEERTLEGPTSVVAADTAGKIEDDRQPRGSQSLLSIPIMVHRGRSQRTRRILFSLFRILCEPGSKFRPIAMQIFVTVSRESQDPRWTYFVRFSSLCSPRTQRLTLLVLSTLTTKNPFAKFRI